MHITIKPTELDKVFSCNHPSVTIEVDGDELNITQILEDLVSPALLAYGFQKETIDKYITLD